MLKNFFSPPSFPNDEEKTRAAYFINIIIGISTPILMLLMAIRLITEGFTPLNATHKVLLGIIIISIMVWTLIKYGQVKLAGYIYIATIWVTTTLVAVNRGGTKETYFLGYFLSMLMAGLLLGWRSSIIFMVISIIAGFGLAIEQNMGIPNQTGETSIDIAIEGSMLFIFGGIFLYLIISTLQNSIQKLKENSSELVSKNQELIELRNKLEARIETRTIELETEKELAEKKSHQFESIVKVSRVISATAELQKTLAQVTEIISEQFGFYHVGIFLNDNRDQFTILSAANSEGGKTMLSRGHQLKIGEQGIVGFATGKGIPRIALDVGTDAVYFNNPYLPNTHSEMALPLKSGEKVIGALDIQSVERNAFSQEDIDVLATLADQVSLVIQNARLFDQTNKLLSESESSRRQYLRASWRQLPNEKKLYGYKYSITGITTLDESSKAELTDPYKREYTVPINLRGENIGVLAIQVPKGEKITPDQMDLIKAVADRVAISAENARLFEETNDRASRERLVSEITTKIRSTNDPQEMIKTAVQELQQALKASRVEIVPKKINPSPDV